MSTEDSAPKAPLLNRLFDLPDVSATPGLRWARPASHMQRPVARGGVLYMDEERLCFRPRGIDTILGARTVEWKLSSITDVALKPSLRKLRITVTTPSGKQRLIVSNPAVVFNDLVAWQKSHRDTAEEGGASA